MHPTSAAAVGARASELPALQAGEACGEIIPFAPGALRFRSFELLPSARILLRHGRPVKIGGRAFDLLHVLLRSRGLVVERAHIVRHVWPATTVDDTSLRFQMSQLRKALGDDRDLLKTVPGRGYMLAADVVEPGADAIEPEVGRTVAFGETADMGREDLARRCEVLGRLLCSALEQLQTMRPDRP